MAERDVLGDPAGQGLDDVRRIPDEIDRRVRTLLHEPLGSGASWDPRRGRAGVRPRRQRPHLALVSGRHRPGGAGRVRVEDRDYEVRFAAAPADLADAIDTAYEDKY